MNNYRVSLAILTPMLTNIDTDFYRKITIDIRGFDED